MSGDLIKKAVLGIHCSGAVLEPNATAAVQAEIDEVLEQVHAVCENKSFVAIQRDDGAWIFVPILGNEKQRNLCTIWPKGKHLNYIALGQEDGPSSQRKFRDIPPDSFRAELDKTYQLLSERWKS